MKNKYNYLSSKPDVGVDEAGVGCLMGPVFASAVLLPEDFNTENIIDSKKLTFKQIEKLAEYIMRNSTYSVGYVEPKMIDEINILNASHKAMNIAISGLLEKVNGFNLIIDGNRFTDEHNIKYTCIVGGDDKYTPIAAASILSKYHRDKYVMEIAHKQYPQYNWVKNKGYGTKEHLDAIKSIGYTDYHRKSFNPLKTLINESKVFKNIN